MVWSAARGQLRAKQISWRHPGPVIVKVGGDCVGQLGVRHPLCLPGLFVLETSVQAVRFAKAVEGLT